MPVCGDHKLTSGFHKSLIKNDTTAKKKHVTMWISAGLTEELLLSLSLSAETLPTVQLCTISALDEAQS